MDSSVTTRRPRSLLGFCWRCATAAGQYDDHLDEVGTILIKKLSGKAPLQSTAIGSEEKEMSVKRRRGKEGTKWIICDGSVGKEAHGTRDVARRLGGVFGAVQLS